MKDLNSQGSGCTPGPSTNHPAVTAGTDQLRELLEQHYPSYYLQIVKSHPHGARYQLLHRGKIALYTASYGAEIRTGTSESFNFYAIMPLRGGGEVTLNGGDVTAPISLIGPQQKIDMHWSLDHEVIVMQIPSAFLQEALETYLGDPPKERLRFEPGVNTTSALGHTFRMLSSAGTGGTLPFAASKLAEHHFEQFLLHTLLSSQSHNYSHELGELPASWIPAALRRATRYCEDHAGEPICLGDIAAAARVSVRTLQLGFREHLQTTPMAYLRSVRLAHAHADLVRIAETDSQTTVTDVALRWGFTHLGRFAALYRQTYGRPPSSTRQGRR
ncbi:AraC family transcriptional regulator [Streptosporangium sp. NPDC000563]|uniref:AraC family transcriptional regulator n=1 Tax=Streptosporangium sp. NPDC000563 TaxID=3154366 RepID=UPI0033200A1C